MGGAQLCVNPPLTIWSPNSPRAQIPTDQSSCWWAPECRAQTSSDMCVFSTVLLWAPTCLVEDETGHFPSFAVLKLGPQECNCSEPSTEGSQEQPRAGLPLSKPVFSGSTKCQLGNSVWLTISFEGQSYGEYWSQELQACSHKWSQRISDVLGGLQAGWGWGRSSLCCLGCTGEAQWGCKTFLSSNSLEWPTHQLQVKNRALYFCVSQKHGTLWMADVQ